MIGNDVVDLQLAGRQSNWQRRGFLDKLFSEREQSLILSSENSDVNVWNLWSKKESAYKIWNRQSQFRTFNPLFFECSSLDLKSEVNFGNQSAFTNSTISFECIQTVAVLNLSDWDLIEEVNATRLVNENGLPFFYEMDERFHATKSHHGKFLKAYYLKREGFNADLPT